MSELAPEAERRIVAQRRRQRAYSEGVYELSDDEGFFCEECDWRGLSSPINDDWLDDPDFDGSPTQCPECGADSYIEEDTSEKYLEQFKPTLDRDDD